MNTKLKWILTIVLVFGILIGIRLIFLNTLPQKQTPQSKDTTVFDSIDTPSDQASYPTNWPEELYYPKQLKLVEAQGNSEFGWIADLTYSGTAKEAAALLENFFVDKGWVVIDRTYVDEGELGFFIEREGKQSVAIFATDISTNTVNVLLNISL